MRWNIPKPFYYFSAGVTVVGGAYLLKDYITGPLYTSNEDLTGKVVIVTGSNTGIGKEIASELANLKAKVIMACRDMEKCEMARQQIVIATKNKYVYCRECDLASQESIKKFVDQFKKEHSKLHILINNAGVMRCPKSYTKEGIEMQLGVNHIGHFLLTNLLLDVIKDSAPSRIINVSSRSHKHGKIKLKDLNSDEHYDPGQAYAQSKLANVLFTRELAKRLEGTGVTVNAVHPGIVHTDIVRHMSIYHNFITKAFTAIVMWLFMKPPKKGAQTVIYAALEPSLKDVTGAYFSNYKVADTSDEAKNDDIAKWLWAVSEKWTRLNHI
ncbi:retinol dehydrogenase 13-like [Hylaeus volcanicus]|uniref:retinol dehydrogenase 13-like n=1 Tax=Hylaeus volcanicus TaxID=313075 RepID=UPI0023B82327|nr:retinol dehydrogenase 13-like [Hylaeus volcanicus]